MSLPGSWLLGKRPPVLRRRELMLGCCKERGNLSSRCEGRSSSREPVKSQSTNAGHGGGSVRSSVEVPVMGMEQRPPHDLNFLFYYNTNLKGYDG